MTDFQYYFHQLPCFNGKKTTVSTDLGWLTAAMKEDVLAQLADGNEKAVFEHEIALQSCTDCDID